MKYILFVPVLMIIVYQYGTVLQFRAVIVFHHGKGHNRNLSLSNMFDGGWIVASLLFFVISIECNGFIVTRTVSQRNNVYLYNSREDVTLIQSFYLNEDDQSLFHEIRPIMDTEEEDEDEVELWYPTTRRSFFIDDGTSIHIRQTSFGCGKLGSSIWPSSIALCCHLLSHTIMENTNKILELGAGCGLPSAFLLASSSHTNLVMATDFWQSNDDANDKDRLFPNSLFGTNLEYNIQKNENTKNVGQVVKYDWHKYQALDDENHPIRQFAPNIIIGSDLIYYPEDVEPFLQTLKRLLSNQKDKVDMAIFFFPLSKDTKREALPEFQRQIIQQSWFPNHHVQLETVQLHQIIYTTTNDNNNDNQSSTTKEEPFLRLILQQK